MNAAEVLRADPISSRIDLRIVGDSPMKLVRRATWACTDKCSAVGGRPFWGASRGNAGAHPAIQVRGRLFRIMR